LQAHGNVIQSNVRSGSVCLDVINQTWSPMFGKIAYHFIFIICTWMLYRYWAGNSWEIYCCIL